MLTFPPLKFKKISALHKSAEKCLEVYKTVNYGRVFPVNSLSLEKRCPHKKACSVLHSSEYSGLDVLAKPPFLPVQFFVFPCTRAGSVERSLKPRLEPRDSGLCLDTQPVSYVNCMLDSTNGKAICAVFSFSAPIYTFILA